MLAIWLLIEKKLIKRTVVDADPDSTYHPGADPGLDLAPAPKVQTLEKVQK
jgi:hypothetical protein